MKNKIQNALRTYQEIGKEHVRKKLNLRVGAATIRKILFVFIILNLLIMGGYAYFMLDATAVAETKDVPKSSPAEQAAPVNAEAQWNSLQKRQEELRIKELELKTLEAQVDAKIKYLEELEALVKQDVETLKTLSDERIKHLVKIYSSMKPKAAANLMDNMDLLVAVEVFHNMKGEIAGGILAYMNASKAASITKMLASYRAATKGLEGVQ